MSTLLTDPLSHALLLIISRGPVPVETSTMKPRRGVPVAIYIAVASTSTLEQPNEERE